MIKLYVTLTSFIFTAAVCSAQVKSNYIYNTNTPYGVLDLRTTISSTHYYYLKENETFSYRESSPGVKTNKFLKMTSFDSSPYKEGHLRKKNGSLDQFMMNYRLLMPVNYNANYSEGYPLILLLHGAVERANCYYNSCYHSNWSYDPNTNSPAAPKTSTHKLLNNDHNLSQGGKVYMDARNLAGSKLPNDPTLAARSFPGFVVVPQMLNVWDSLNVQDAIRLVQLIQKKYKIDPNRIYVQGLSIGGFATYQAIKRAPWLFAAALPMAGVHDANIIKQNQQAKLAHMPLWIFQGGKDTNPTPAYTNDLVSKLRAAGSVINYSLYADVGHTCWHKAFSEPKYFSWMLAQTKANITPAKGNTVINTSKAIYPKLMLAEGFFAYQWEKDGVIISGSSHTYIAKVPGTYRARFSRVASPTASQWNKWSNPVIVTTATTAAGILESTLDSLSFTSLEDAPFQVHSFPNPSSPDNINIQINTDELILPIDVQIVDQMGKTIFRRSDSPDAFRQGINPGLDKSTSAGIYVLTVKQGEKTIRQKIMINQQ